MFKIRPIDRADFEEYVYDEHFLQSMDQPGIFANPARGKLNRENILIFPCPRWRLRLWSHEMGLAVQPRVCPLIDHTQAESDWLMLTRGFLYFLPLSVKAFINGQPLSGHSRVYCVMQSRLGDTVEFIVFYEYSK